MSDVFDNLSANLENKNLRTTLVFQGGGAKGLIHVGALRAIEESEQNEVLPNFKVCGYAGTSIGALVAALASVGYKSTELISESGKFTLLPNASSSLPVQILGKWGWRKIKLTRDIVRLVVSPTKSFFHRPAEAVGPIIFVFSFVALISSLIVYLGWAGVIAVTIFLLLAFQLIMRFGLVTFDEFADRLNALLVDRFLSLRSDNGGQRSDEDIKKTGLLFADLSNDGRRLRIVASDMSGEAQNLFSEATTRDVRIADAVSASMAIPFLVRAVQINNRPYLDGGIVSNVPVWTFDDVRRIDPDVVTISLELSGTSLTKKVDNLKVKTFIGVILFGSQAVESQNAMRLFRSPMTSDNIKLLDFDLDEKSIKNAVNDGLLARNKHLHCNFVQIPGIYKDAMEEIAIQLEYEFFNHLNSKKKNQNLRDVEKPSIRVFFAQQLKDTLALKIRFGRDLDTPNCDDRLILPFDSSLAGKSFKSKTPKLANSTELKSRILTGRADRYRKVMKWQDAKWCLCVPINNKCTLPENCTPGVVIIESNFELSDWGLHDSVEDGSWQTLLSFIQQKFVRAIAAEHAIPNN